jgi:hypothetical protein
LQQPYQQDFADGFIRIKMNEEIKQLGIQSGLLFQRDKLSYEEKKFAELIVRRCLDKIENGAMQYSEPVWAVELLNDIKEHFGIKETL